MAQRLGMPCLPQSLRQLVGPHICSNSVGGVVPQQLRLGVPVYTLTFRPDDGGPDVHIEPANGRAFDVEPLNHQALYGYTTAEACFPMTLKNAVINGPAWEGGSTHTITAKISAEAENPMYGLVVGGWLPFPFASSGFAMVDRNVVSCRIPDDHMAAYGTNAGALCTSPSWSASASCC